MYDHIGLKVKDLNASVRFFKAALAPLGYELCSHDETGAGFGPKGAPALWLSASKGSIGPGVHIYTATHPIEAEERRTGLESGKPVTIGDDVWIGGRVVVCPGVRIGAGSVIGTGSVVTRDIPPGVLAAGSPCKVIRRI